MAALDTLINVNISQQTSTVPTASFQIPLIIGSSMTGWADYVHSYTSPASMLDDGFTTSSPEYLYAEELYEQAQSPSEFYVGKRTAAVAQVNTLAVATLSSGHDYEFTLNGQLIAYTASGGDTQQSILTALLAAIATAFPLSNPVNGVVAGTGSGALLTLTSAVAGQGVSYTLVDSELTLASVTANNGIVDDVLKIINQDSTWYGIVLCSDADNDILQLAAFVEGVKKIFIATSQDSAIATSSTTDIASVLKGKSYKRTALLFSPASFNLGIDSAWMGGQLPATPGSNNWAYKTLVGISPDKLSDTQRSICIGDPVAGIAGKNVNIFTTVGGVNITQMGVMVGGQYIDITIGIDWLQSTIQSNIYTALTQSSKIPYTDKGTSILISAVKSAIDQGVVNGFIDGASPISIIAPPVLSVPSSQRANRIAPTISFSCRLAGAYNAVVVSGTVTV